MTSKYKAGDSCQKKRVSQRARSCPQFPRSTHGTPGTMTPLLARKTVAFYNSDPLRGPSNNNNGDDDDDDDDTDDNDDDYNN